MEEEVREDGSSWRKERGLLVGGRDWRGRDGKGSNSLVGGKEREGKGVLRGRIEMIRERVG